MLSWLFVKTIQIKKCSHHKLLAYIVEIYLIIISLCFTFVEPFNDIFLFFKSSCALVSGNTNKRLRPKEGLNDQASEFTLAHLTPISHSAK